WLARNPFGYMVLDRESGEFFLRTRSAIFPGMKLAEIFDVTEGPLYEEMKRNILHVNGPDHTRLRSLVNPALSPRAVERYRPQMREFLEQLLEQAIRWLAEHPEQWRLLAQRPELADQAVDEALRYEPITPFTARITTEDVVFRDVTFPEGTLVMVCAFTGNRDLAPAAAGQN